MDTFLPPIENPQSLMMKLAYYFTRRQFGKVLTPPESAFRAVAACFRSILHKDRQARQKAAASTGDCAAYPRTSGTHQHLPFLHGHWSGVHDQSVNEPSQI